MERKKLFKGYLFVILSAVIYGMSPLMARGIYAMGVDPKSLVFLRNLISVPLLFCLALYKNKSVRIEARAAPYTAFIALMGCCVTPLLLFSSYNYISAGTAEVFHFIYPAAVVLGEFMLFKSRITAGRMLSVLLCIAGVALFYSPGNDINVMGGMLALLSGFAYAVYIISLSGFKYRDMGGFTFSFYIAVFSSVIMLLACLIAGNITYPVSAAGWLLVLLFAVMTNIAALVLFQEGTFLIGGSGAAILGTLEPVTSILVDLIIFNIAMTALNFAGSLLVIAASILIAVLDMKTKA